jgi:hypothetical protein
MSSELDIAEVEDGTIVMPPESDVVWPQCLCCREKLILATDVVSSSTQASCCCGIWSSRYFWLGEFDPSFGSSRIVRVTHPWGMNALGKNFFDAVSKIVL